MKKQTLLIITTLLLTGAALFAQAPSLLKWAFDDSNGDSVWNWSETNHHFESGNEYGDIPLSYSEVYEGTSSFRFSYINESSQYPGNGAQTAYGLISTGYANPGVEPQSDEEKVSSKDLSPYNYLNFYVKGDKNSVIYLTLKSPNAHNSLMVNAADYMGELNNTNWQLVSIPMKAFGNPNTVYSIYDVHAVMFWVPQYASYEDFTFYVDNISFSKPSMNPDYTYWFRKDANVDGVLNYSYTDNYGGSYVVPGNQWGDIPVKTIFYGPGPYQSSAEALDFQFVHNGTGQAFANITTGWGNEGLEAGSFDERDGGKYVGYDKTLKFATYSSTLPVKILLVDKWGNSSASLVIEDYFLDSPNPYGIKGAAIPVEDFFTEALDVANIKAVTVFVDGEVAAGNYNFVTWNMRFE